ncbi:MAG: hypothetical protein A2Z71_00995 [Chloroflexi bacterium RBG_13_50_21]|nr:MAG: hypothetical protein A2Z71_00995 [Chloroflexi bacterium RBG_13_50_21]OGO66800.1 MAG: hypothetical protein A2029_12085 [Chloroflexi bacterium RBG_19FT_COMBO_47_9]
MVSPRGVDVGDTIVVDTGVAGDSSGVAVVDGFDPQLLIARRRVIIRNNLTIFLIAHLRRKV